jgi:DNA-binding IscR family transcriptional regulator
MQDSKEEATTASIAQKVGISPNALVPMLGILRKQYIACYEKEKVMCWQLVPAAYEALLATSSDKK